GLASFLAGDYSAAREVLEPVDGKLEPLSPEWHELLYYLGEANWHDGRHARAFDYFKQILERDPHFGAANVHAWHYAVARRDNTTARFYVGLGAENRAWPEFPVGHYKQLAETGPAPFRQWAQMVIGQSTPELDTYVSGDGVGPRTFRTALAIRDGDLD